MGYIPRNVLWWRSLSPRSIPVPALFNLRYSAAMNSTPVSVWIDFDIRIPLAAW